MPKKGTKIPNKQCRGVPSGIQINKRRGISAANRIHVRRGVSLANQIHKCRGVPSGAPRDVVIKPPPAIIEVKSS